MKKKYITPDVVTYSVTKEAILAGSDLGYSSTIGDPTKPILSKRGIDSWDEDEDY